MSSQPQLYQFVKEEAPKLYEQIRARVAEGRWEPEGGMFVEADCNLTGGRLLFASFLRESGFSGKNSEKIVKFYGFRMYLDILLHFRRS